MALKYHAILVGLLPQGKIWCDSWLNDLFLGLAISLKKLEDYIERIFIRELPDRIDVYAPEWTEILGLKVLSANQIRSKLGIVGDQSQSGYQRTISSIAGGSVELSWIDPAYVGMNCGDYVAGDEWAFVVQVKNIQNSSIEPLKEAIESIKHADLVFLYNEAN